MHKMEKKQNKDNQTSLYTDYINLLDQFSAELSKVECHVEHNLAGRRVLTFHYEELKGAFEIYMKLKKMVFISCVGDDGKKQVLEKIDHCIKSIPNYHDNYVAEIKTEIDTKFMQITTIFYQWLHDFKDDIETLILQDIAQSSNICWFCGGSAHKEMFRTHTVPNVTKGGLGDIVYTIKYHVCDECYNHFNKEGKMRTLGVAIAFVIEFGILFIIFCVYGWEAVAQIMVELGLLSGLIIVIILAIPYFLGQFIGKVLNRKYNLRHNKFVRTADQHPTIKDIDTCASLGFNYDNDIATRARLNFEKSLKRNNNTGLDFLNPSDETISRWFSKTH